MDVLEGRRIMLLDVRRCHGRESLQCGYVSLPYEDGRETPNNELGHCQLLCRLCHVLVGGVDQNNCFSSIRVRSLNLRSPKHENPRD